MTCKYCDFLQVRDEQDAVVEVCKRCGKKIIYRKCDGKIDNEKYLRDHIRDFCQPQGSTKQIYLEIYGKKAYERSMAMRQTRETITKEEAILEAKHDAKIWERLSNKGFSEEELQRQYKLQTG